MISIQPVSSRQPDIASCNFSLLPITSESREIAMTDAAEHFDVLIVGAGLSGIGAGYHLQQKCPGKSYVILEGRDCIGGTWDLFRYPGIRSDSRHVYARLFVQTVDRAEGDRRRAADPELRARDRCRQRHRQARSASTTASNARRGRRRRRAGPWRPSARWARARPRSCASPAISCSCARAITNTRKATRRSLPGLRISPARSCIRRNGLRISTTPASAWW